MHVATHRDLTVVGNFKSGGHKGLGKTSGNTFGVFWRIKRSSASSGSPGEYGHENLKSELVNF